MGQCAALHKHVYNEKNVLASSETDLKEVLAAIRTWMKNNP
jgi:hypothetical protein